MEQTNQNQRHVPVLVREVLGCLAPRSGESYLDLTAGYGGHAAEILARTRRRSSATLVDRDAEAIAVLRATFHGAEILHQDFFGASQRLDSEKRHYDMILADLGVSSPHLQNAGRGFTFAADAPLDMRMDQSQDQTAADVVNTYSEAKLADVLRDYGEEPKARTIARLIVQARPLHNTGDLAKIASRAWPGHSRVHPATRTFQALRIAVNDELNQIAQSLPIWVRLLNPGGRIAVISFHSLEDRLVKRAFSEVAGDGFDAELKLLTKGPMSASQQEIAFNPRSRSAKLRAAVKIKIERSAQECLSS